MAASGNAKHKNLASSFGAPTAERGSKLQGLLRAPSGPAAPVNTPQPAPPSPDAPEPVAQPSGTASPASDDAAAAAPHAQPVLAETSGAVATRVAAPPRRRRTAASGGVPASSVYLTADAYKQLTTTKSRKIKDYAQIVQDAFARIAKEAADQGKAPDDVLASLFEVPQHDDPWLMPSSTTRSKSSGAPLTEARISFSAQQREWIEQKMATVKVKVSFSEFIARVLEHHLMPEKAKRGK